MNPSLRHHEVATRLRALRLDAGLTMKEAAERLECSVAKISRLETAARGVSPRDVRDLCVIYGADPEEAAGLIEMARQARTSEWWEEYPDERFRSYIGHEADATSILSYDSGIFPGIVQTREYARAIILGVAERIGADTLDKRVELRMRRQEILHKKDPPRVHVIVDESAVHRRVGGAEVLYGQLSHLLDLARRPGVTLQVIPFAAGAHQGLNEAFTLLEMADPIPDVIYQEVGGRIEYFRKDKELLAYRRLIDHLRATGLGHDASMALIEEVSQKYSF
ncbi:helix-turn-helix domain-containing protein [Sphaerisporangium melleum]|uniref:helix-turn-helix domain-containing protein n=1 Tax=Sphaerisporangium melleum TaxID=321316 RepID=UPI001663B8FA|nr:helix-turn-helix transcriptional regulator [Sphaerisporangium melleum]